MFKKLYLPVGMLVMLALSLVYPAAGSWIKPLHLNNVFIILIFLVCGWQTSMEGMKFDRKFAFLFGAGAVISLAVSPWIAMGLARLLQLPELPVVGLVVISAVPPTLSSGIVLTETAFRPQRRVTATVTRDAIAMCTMLVPIRMVVTARSKSSSTSSALRARGSPRSAAVFILLREAAAKAVSATPKYAAQKSSAIAMIHGNRLPSSMVGYPTPF